MGETGAELSKPQLEYHDLIRIDERFWNRKLGDSKPVNKAKADYGKEIKRLWGFKPEDNFYTILPKDRRKDLNKSLIKEVAFSRLNVLKAIQQQFKDRRKYSEVTAFGLPAQIVECERALAVIDGERGNFQSLLTLTERLATKGKSFSVQPPRERQDEVVEFIQENAPRWASKPSSQIKTFEG